MIANKPVLVKSNETLIANDAMCFDEPECRKCPNYDVDATALCRHETIKPNEPFIIFRVIRTLSDDEPTHLALSMVGDKMLTVVLKGISPISETGVSLIEKP